MNWTSSGRVNLDTPWLYLSSSHRLSRQHGHTLQLNSELTADKWVSVPNLVLEASYRDRGRQKEAHLELGTPAVTFLQVMPNFTSRMMSASVIVGNAPCAPPSPLTGRRTGIEGKEEEDGRLLFSQLPVDCPPERPHLSGEPEIQPQPADVFQLRPTKRHLRSCPERHRQGAPSAPVWGKCTRFVLLTHFSTIPFKPLKKRQARVSASLSEPKSPPTEFELEGTLEELTKDKKMHQTTALLLLRSGHDFHGHSESFAVVILMSGNPFCAGSLSSHFLGSFSFGRLSPPTSRKAFTSWNPEPLSLAPKRSFTR